MCSNAARKVAKTLAAVTVGASTSEAAIVVFDINPDVQTRSASMLGFYDGSALSLNNINLTAGTFTSSFSSGSYEAVYSSILNSQFTFGAFRNANYLPNQFVTGGVRGNLVGPGSGQSFGSSSLWVEFAFATDDLAAGTGYIGLALANGSGGYNYGWIEFTHSNAGDLWTRFAFETVLNQSILAGDTGTPVPEASTLGFAGGLFGLVAAAHLRRRKLKQAAASDKFLALAAGEKLN